MIKLHNTKMLQTLHQSLTKRIPESLKVFGSIFHINHGNPFNLEVLVDSWPDYQTVITRPQKQEMTDDKDYYTNTYHIFSKDIQKLPDILGSDHVINWKQSFMIQGCQNGLNEKISEVVAFKPVHVDYSKRVLYVIDDVLKYCTFNTSKLSISCKVKSSENVMFRSTNDNFRLSLLDISHAKLVNDNWKYGQNERSLRYIKRCLQSFPGYCLLNPEGNPVSWLIKEQTGELRMGYTLPEYRKNGFAKWIMATFMQHLQKNYVPFYGHVEEMNEQGHNLAKSVGFHVVDCNWHEWKCVPTEQL
uniref:Glycine N-acyltransferase-like protein n=1 Tax=Monodelphis domestica TaxID=13616 RepID=A0A5F8GS07_MONDO